MFVSVECEIDLQRSKQVLAVREDLLIFEAAAHTSTATGTKPETHQPEQSGVEVLRLADSMVQAPISSQARCRSLIGSDQLCVSSSKFASAGSC